MKFAFNLTVSMAVWLLVLVSLFILFIICWKKRKYFLFGLKLPGPPGFPLLGNLLVFRTRNFTAFFKYLLKLLQIYEHIVRLWLGPVLLVIVSGPNEIGKIAESDKIGYRGKYGQKVLGRMFENGLLSIDEKLWRPHRKIISAAFHINILEKYVDDFAKSSTILVNRLRKIADGSTLHDVYPYLFRCTLDTICETCFAYEINAQTNEESEFVHNSNVIMEVTMARISDPLLIFDWIFNMTKLGKKYKVSVDYYHDIIRSVIQEKILNRKSAEEINKRPTVMDLLLQNGELSSDEIVGEMSTIGGAGSETTATACSFALALLGEHQDIQEKVMEEQRSVFGKDMLRMVTSEDLPNMPYLEQVLNESMRLFPPLPFFGREVSKDVDVGGGKIIPGGTAILVAPFVTHRNPEHFPDPERFDPERFSPENISRRHKYAFIPFGYGRRMCVGRNFAIMEAKTILSTVLRRYHIGGVQGGIEGLQRDLLVSFVLTSANGIRLKLLPRTYP